MAKTALELGPEGWKKYFRKPMRRTRPTQKKKSATPARRQAQRATVEPKRSDGDDHRAKTALELGPEGWKHYSPQRRRPRGWPKRLRMRAWRVARKAARVLREQFGATRVVVFGSLAHNLWYSPQSDIDLAAWGIEPGEFYNAAGTVADMKGGFKIDVVDPETCRPSVRQEIKEDGIDL